MSIDTGESEWHRPDDPWQQTESGDGDTFFFNVATDESLWQHPLEWKQLERGSSVYSNGEGDVWDSGCVEGEVFLEDPVDVSSTPAGHQSDDHTAPAATDDDTRGAHAIDGDSEAAGKVEAPPDQQPPAESPHCEVTTIDGPRSVDEMSVPTVGARHGSQQGAGLTPSPSPSPPTRQIPLSSYSEMDDTVPPSTSAADVMDWVVDTLRNLPGGRITLSRLGNQLPVEFKEVVRKKGKLAVFLEETDQLDGQLSVVRDGGNSFVELVDATAAEVAGTGPAGVATIVHWPDGSGAGGGGAHVLEDPTDVSSPPAGHQSDHHTAPTAADDGTRGVHAIDGDSEAAGQVEAPPDQQLPTESPHCEVTTSDGPKLVDEMSIPTVGARRGSQTDARLTPSPSPSPPTRQIPLSSYRETDDTVPPSTSAADVVNWVVGTLRNLPDRRIALSRLGALLPAEFKKVRKKGKLAAFLEENDQDGQLSVVRDSGCGFVELVDASAAEVAGAGRAEVATIARGLVSSGAGAGAGATIEVTSDHSVETAARRLAGLPKRVFVLHDAENVALRGSVDAYVVFNDTLRAAVTATFLDDVRTMDFTSCGVFVQWKYVAHEVAPSIIKGMRECGAEHVDPGEKRGAADHELMRQSRAILRLLDTFGAASVQPQHTLFVYRTGDGDFAPEIQSVKRQGYPVVVMNSGDTSSLTLQNISTAYLRTWGKILDRAAASLVKARARHPATPTQSQGSPRSTKPHLFKTVLCNYYNAATKTCKNGDSCTYAHGRSDLKLM